MQPKPLPDEVILDILTRLRLDPDTGVVTWRFGQRTGKPVGSPHSKGYLTMCYWFNGKSYMLLMHQVVWLLHTGVWSAVHLDHEDRNKRNNRPNNLRPATKAQNNQNKDVTPETGTDRLPSGRWRSRIMLDYKLINLGTFDTQEEAHQVYLAKKRELHPYFEVVAA